MTPHQVKEGFLSLPPRAKREFVLWAVQREFSDEQTSELEPAHAETVKAALAHGKHSGGVSTSASPGLSAAVKAVLGILILAILAGAGWFLAQESKEAPQSISMVEKADAMAEAQLELEAQEAARPQSPTNLEYLNQRVGSEVTLRGVPVRAEVGYLYFHKNPEMGARVKLISGGVVVYQSTELEQWVKDKQEIEVRGKLIRTEEENLLEIPVERQVQVKLVEKK